MVARVVRTVHVGGARGTLVVVVSRVVWMVALIIIRGHFCGRIPIVIVRRRGAWHTNVIIVIFARSRPILTVWMTVVGVMMGFIDGETRIFRRHCHLISSRLWQVCRFVFLLFLYHGRLALILHVWRLTFLISIAYNGSMSPWQRHSSLVETSRVGLRCCVWLSDILVTILVTHSDALILASFYYSRGCHKRLSLANLI